MTTYLIQVSVALILFYGTYILFLKQETNFRLIRYFLLFFLLTSALLPIFDFGMLISYFIERTNSIHEYWLPDITTTAIKVTRQNGSNLIWEIVIWVYVAGVAFSTLRLLISLFKLRRIISHSKIVVDNQGSYYLLEDGAGSFSFFNYIFIGSKSWYSEDDKKSILTHERAHTRNWHSADVMLVQLLGILVWFNPIIYWYRKTLEELHEYEADEIASGQKTEDYCGLLVKDVLTTTQLNIANHFNKSLTLKRITMIQSMKRKMSGAKKFGVIGVVLLLVVGIACEEKMLADLKKAASQSVLLTEYPSHVHDVVNNLKIKYPQTELRVYGLVKGSNLDHQKLSQYGNPINIFKADDPDYEFYMIISSEDLQMGTEAMVDVKNGETIHYLVQEAASPKNGMTEFYQYVASNLKYPEQARKMGIEGRVFLRFLVDESGKLSNFEVVRGIGAGCDAEAVRVVQASPNWKPGMQDGKAVKSIFNLAIIFKLGYGTEQKGE
jgi:TonB family protein